MVVRPGGDDGGHRSPFLSPSPVDAPFPTGYRPGIGIIGCGGIVNEAHLPVYRRHGIPVAGVFDISPRAAQATARAFDVPKVYASVEQLLSDPAVEIVDIATHPGARPEFIHRALDADKHVFAQKPLASSMDDAEQIQRHCASSHRKVAVNQNGRWAPPWYGATQLIRGGAIGEISAITFLQNTNFSYMVGTTFDQDPRFAILDYSIHWIDIACCWMDATPIAAVRARQYRVPEQPATSIAPWGLWLEIVYANGVNAMIRGVGCTWPETQGHPFWVHGTAGTLRGSVRHHEFLEIDRPDGTRRLALRGEWYLDGFAGAFGELLAAIVEDREPHNSVADNLRTLGVTLAACASSLADGAPIPVPGGGPSSGPSGLAAAEGVRT